MKLNKWYSWVIIIVIGVGIYFLANKLYIKAMELHPLSADGMTTEERNIHDSKLIEEKIAKFNLVKEVEVNYEDKSIKVVTNIYTGERRSEDQTTMIQEEVKKIIRKNTENLTIDDYYPVIVYSKDGDLLSK